MACPLKFSYQTKALAFNPAPPLIMHVDLNSCFASIEQQANPLLRGAPLAMTNRMGANPTIIAASYEAKDRGVKVGMKVLVAKQIIPNLVVLETDPPKYLFAYQTFKEILAKYSADTHMKSIDEGVVDLTKHLVRPADMLDIGLGIKNDLAKSLGKYVTCNVGIGPNRFLAKLAANLHKPDGLDVINQLNVAAIYQKLKLTDLPGINQRYQARLIRHGIATPYDLYLASSHFLAKEVFKSITGYYWYWRLRGYEVDSAISGVKSVGKQYVLPFWTNDNEKLAPIVLKMCTLLGQRLRRDNWCARGLSVGCWFIEAKGWHHYQKLNQPLFTTNEIHSAVEAGLALRPPEPLIQTLSIACHRLEPAQKQQVDFFEQTGGKWQLTEAIDRVNHKFGALTLVPAALVGTDELVAEKIPFGNRHLNIR